MEFKVLENEEEKTIENAKKQIEEKNTKKTCKKEDIQI